jgi:predicted Zn-dependent protease
LYTIPTIAAAVGSILVATQNPSVGSGALAATLASNQQAMINFTRENEAEADRIGIENMAKAGFDPRAMPRFFERMADRNRYMPKIPDFLLNHPVTERRIVDSRLRAEKFPGHQFHENPDFYLIQQRVAIDEENNPQESIERLRTEIENSGSAPNEAVEYGYVIALIKAFQLDDAQKEAEKLIARHPNQYIYQLALADIENFNKNFSSAIERLQKAQSAHPNTRAIPIQLANTALNAGQGKLALVTLQNYVRNYPDDSNAFELLTEANAVVGNSIGAHQAQAEQYALEGDYSGAIDQLDNAQKLTDKNKYLSARIKARKTQFEKLLAEQKKNKKNI